MTTLVKISLVVVALFFTVGVVVAGVSSLSTPAIQGLDTSIPEATPVTSQVDTLEATPENSPEVEGTTIQDDLVKVVRVVDGDTFEIEGGEKIRMIGIDTPETVDPRKSVQCFGKEASNKTKELLEGKTVRLVKDVSERDKYQRLLRYVYVGDIFINDLLVRDGFAKSSSYPPDIKFQEQFRQSEEVARNGKVGLWSSLCDTPTITPVPQTPVPLVPQAQKAPATTKAPVATKAPTKTTTCSSNIYNCSDFSTCSEAQAVFNQCSTDVHGLDRDKDGIPCDTLCQ